MLINGRTIASEILRDVASSLSGSMPVVRAIVMQPSPATESYLHIKQIRAEEAGMHLQLIRMEDDATTEDIIAKIALAGSDAMLVQLPLPEHIDTERVLASIPLAQDADVLSETAYQHFEQGAEHALVPPVAGAVAEILKRAHIEVAGKRAVVVGQGKLVGRPVLALLKHLHVDAITIYRDTPDPGSVLREADIIVSGAGQAHFITADMVKEGVVLIDAGTSESNGTLAGDFHPDCSAKASVFTPVPGGVGPVAVAMLFKNVAELALKA